jgi:hypothetical protein
MIQDLAKPTGTLPAFVLSHLPRGKSWQVSQLDTSRKTGEREILREKPVKVHTPAAVQVSQDFARRHYEAIYHGCLVKVSSI